MAKIQLINLTSKKCDACDLVGGKGTNLAKLSKIEHIATKPGFVVPSHVYVDCVSSQVNRQLKELNRLQSSKPLDKGAIEGVLSEIRMIISNLTLEEDETLASLDSTKHYAVRSSGTAEDGKNASFSGKFDTHLYVKKHHIIQEIKRVWQSVFTFNNLEYCQAYDLDLTQIKMAVVIQEMSNPLAAGTVFTNTGKTEIDVAFGLGEAVVRGDMPTDKIIVDPRNGEIISTEISTKRTHLIYSQAAETVVASPLLPDQSRALSLNFNQIKQLNQQIDLLKAAYPDCPHGLDVEFSLDKDGELYILQVRPVTVPMVNNHQQIDVKKCQSYFIGKGDPVSHYIACGLLSVCQTPTEAEQAIEAAEKIGKKVIIVTANTTSQWETVMRRSAGIIAETGSTNCHTAIACREMHIAGITGYEGAMQHLQTYQNQEVTVCGVSGYVYQGDQTAEKNRTAGDLQTKYTPIETEKILPKQKHLEAAIKAGMIQEHDGIAFIGKPITPTSLLINTLDLAAHQRIQELLALNPATYHLTPDHILLMNFDDCHTWRMQIRSWSEDKHQSVLALRKKAEREFLEASRDLQFNAASIDRWFKAYQQKIGFDNVAYAIGEILNGLLHQMAMEKGIQEPVLSDLVPAAIESMGHFELTKCQETIRQIQSSLSGHQDVLNNIKALETMYSSSDKIGDAEIITAENRLIAQLKQCGLYEPCKKIATSYRIREKDFSLTFLEPWFQQSSAPWLRLLIESKKLTQPPPQPLSKREKKYFPEDPALCAMIDLTASSKKLHMDGHQTKTRGLWQFIALMQKLSLVSGYTTAELLNKPHDTIIELVAKINLMTKPGLETRPLSQEQQEQLKVLENSNRLLNAEQVASITSFCQQLPTSSDLQKQGFQKREKRTVFPSTNTGLPAELEAQEQRVSDTPEPLPPHLGRIENKRPQLEDTQYQIATPKGCIVTMVALSQNKTRLDLPNQKSIGKEVAYTAPYKWRNSAFVLDSRVQIDNEHYDKISCYSHVIDQHFISNFAKHNMAERLTALSHFNFDEISEGSPQIFEIHLNSNTRTQSISLRQLVTELKLELEAEQHLLAMTDQESPAIMQSSDGAVPKMQAVVQIPAEAQHETFIASLLTEFNFWRHSNQAKPIDETWLFDPINAHFLTQYLDHFAMTSTALEQFWQAHEEARKFREYQRKPKLSIETSEGKKVEISMNDSVDIPSQALMMVVDQSSPTETNRPVNLWVGYDALTQVIHQRFAGEMQNIILSNLAYTQASSTPSMLHFHLVPNHNSEGKFMIPYLDGKEEEYGPLIETNITGVKVAYLLKEAQKHAYDLVKFEVDLNHTDADNQKTIKAIDQKLQSWELQTGCDMTWVAKFHPATKTLILCVELRAGINQFTDQQINELRDRGLWEKIGFTEVMGKKYSMLSQEHVDKAMTIDQNHPELAKKMLDTPLYCVQTGPNGHQLFYPFQADQEELSAEKDQKTKAIIHIARLLQVYDAEIFTQSLAALYRLQAQELLAFKDLFMPHADLTSLAKFLTKKWGEKKETSHISRNPHGQFCHKINIKEDLQQSVDFKPPGS